MKGAEAIKLSGRSETWLRNHECAWCGQTLWRSLVHGCGAILDKCEPDKRDFTSFGKLIAPTAAEDVA